jgi:V/A-type H+-transporting ATPase subunit E
MNGIEKITDRIAIDADAQAKALLDHAKKQSAEIAAGYAALAESQYTETVEKGKADAADRVVRLGGVAQLEARKRKLAAKQALLEQAFDLALEKLLALPDDQYVDLLAKLAAEGCTTGREALVLSVADRPRYGKRVVTQANARLEAAGKTALLTLSEESREFRGGLYIQDGNVENNCTFPTIVRMLREQMAGQVAQILFD